MLDMWTALGSVLYNEGNQSTFTQKGKVLEEKDRWQRRRRKMEREKREGDWEF